MQYWLMKTEPSTFSIDDLKAMPNATEHWDGVRNYQARNFMKAMQKGDKVFFYHSNCKEPSIVGTAKVVTTAYPDFTAQDPDSNYFDPRSNVAKPIWEMVDIKFTRKFKRNISLSTLKAIPELSDMLLVRKGNRLSITPVTEQHWDLISALT
ncbi:MAG: EVE domain-containing protein [Thiotrichales bacterium]|nr:MAG: EVE domain-containing protein [Thiotrichales bacterium]